MIRILILLAFAASSGFAHFSDWDDNDGPDTVKPPFCNCSEEKEERFQPHHFMRWRHEQNRGRSMASTEDWQLKKQICGTDNVTYATKCDFINKLFSDSTLGKRCHGPCPCNDQKEFPMNPHFQEKSAICLNNGVTVYGLEELMEAKKQNSAVGPRCHGECSQCSNDLKCPRRHGRRFEEFRNISGFAPNCSCTLPSDVHFTKFLSSNCGQKFLKEREVCGSDGVTYADKCAFKNKQTAVPDLGKRCSGSCPCDFEFIDHGRQKGFEKMRGGRHLGESKPYCLNNGTTIYGHPEKIEALRNNAHTGIRCKGECSECQSDPIFCPLDWHKIMEEKEKNRPKPPNCTCPSTFGFAFGHRQRGICGNDNKTYANICELINNQSSNPNLGFRCLGKCPCKNRTADELAQIKDEEASTDDNTELPASKDSANKIPNLDDENTNKENMFDEREEETTTSNPTEGDQEKGADEMEPFEHRHHRHHRRRHHWKRPVCLTNGETVRGWWKVSKAFDEDVSLGIRCRGHCDFCLNHSRCPRVPTAEEVQKMQIKAKEWHNRWQEMTMESPESPPNCKCQPFDAEKNDSSMHHGGWKHRGHHGFGLHPKFVVCGTDNVTYSNWCDLVNNQSKNSGLGTRCWGQCPCDPDEFDTSDLSEKGNNSMGHEFNFTVCLTNGKTVQGFAEKMKALADPMIGVRCLNECSICQQNLKCPRILKPGKSFFSHAEDRSEQKWNGEKGKENWRSESDGQERMRGRFEHKHLEGSRFFEKRNKSFWEFKSGQPTFQFEKSFDFGLGWMGKKNHREHDRHHERGRKDDDDDECFDEMD